MSRLSQIVRYYHAPMSPLTVRASLSGLVLSVVAVANGGCGDSESAKAANTAVEAQPCWSDMSCSIQNISIEAPAAEGAVRQYYGGLVRRDGEVYDMGLLVVTQSGAASPKSYEFTEYRTELDNGEWLRRTTRSSGTVTTSDIDTPYGRDVVYRFDGGASPSQARVLVGREGRALLNVPTDPAAPQAGVEEGFGVKYAATAAKGRVEISEGFSEFVNWRVRLLVGDEFAVRLQRLSEGGWSVKPESTGDRLQLQGSTEDGNDQVFTFTVVERGTTELALEYRLVDTRELVQTTRIPIDVK